MTEHLPPWVPFDDVKHQYDVTMQSTAIASQPGAQDIEISSSRISRFHDAITAVTRTGTLQIWGNEFTDIQDDAVQLGTDAYDVEIHLLRGAGPQRRLQMCAQLSTATRQLALAGLRERYPDASDAFVRKKLTERVYGPAVAERLFGHVDRYGVPRTIRGRCRVWPHRR